MKLSNATREEKLKACAELDGKVYHKPTPEEVASGSYYQYEPCYDTSYDAILPVIHKQPYSTKLNMAVILYGQNNIVTGEAWTNEEVVSVAFDSTPSQLLDALLIATGRMEV